MRVVDLFEDIPDGFVLLKELRRYTKSEPGREDTILPPEYCHPCERSALHLESRTVNRICLHRVDWSPEACLALLICALGTISTSLDGGCVLRDSEAYRTAEPFFVAAKKRLGLILGTSGLIEAQCMFFAVSATGSCAHV